MFSTLPEMPRRATAPCDIWRCAAGEPGTVCSKSRRSAAVDHTTLRRAPGATSCKKIVLPSAAENTQAKPHAPEESGRKGEPNIGHRRVTLQTMVFNLFASQIEN